MNRKLLSIALLVTFSLLVGIIVDRATSKSTNAQQADSNLSDKWEYAVITHVFWDSERKTYHARICYFRTSGCNYSDIDAPPLSEGDVGTYGEIKTLAKASATLGQNGWEMIGEAPIGQSGDHRRLFFKRRQR